MSRERALGLREQESARQTQRKVPRIAFEIDRERIRPEAAPILRAIADRLRERPAARVEIQVHTDPAWVCEHCAQRLTDRRARSVREALIHLGIDRERLTARGYEGERPLRLCDTVRGRRRRGACRRQNLRVELHLLRRNNGE